MLSTALPTKSEQTPLRSLEGLFRIPRVFFPNSVQAHYAKKKKKTNTSSAGPPPTGGNKKRNMQKRE